MTFLESRWGLQLIAEEGFGRAIASEAEGEDAAFNAARQALGG